MRRLTWLGWACVLAATAAVAACSGSSSSSGTSSTTTTTSDPGALVPAGTPIGHLTLTGDAGSTGPMGDVSIRCGFPNLQGISIAMLGQAYDATTHVRVSVRAGNITMQLSTGTGTDYHERAFAGSGVTGFDAGKGATIDSPMTETAATSGTTKGTVPAITSVDGSIDCHDQNPGSSTLTLTGDTAEGVLAAAALSDARVECNTDSVGNEAVVSGILTIGSTKAFASIGLRVDGLSLQLLLESGTRHDYVAPAGAATPTPTGGHASGDAVEQTTTAPRTVHVEGDVTCGSPA
jgi:hypothetical protein